MLDKKKLPKPAIMNPNYISLPSEWDSSVSQLEMLQRMLYNINQLISCIGEFADEVEGLDNKLDEVLNNFQPIITDVVENYFKFDTVYFGITDSGYFVATIPDEWSNITFNTTEYDIFLPIQPEFGHLVLSY